MFLTTALYVALLAPGGVEQARTLYQAGSKAYRVGRYDIAIDAFESARRMSERDVVVFALAQAYRLRYFQGGDLDDLTAAVAAYRRYLEIKPEGERAFHAIRHLSTIQPYLEQNRIDAAAADPPPPRARLIVVSDVEGATARVGEGPAQPVPATFEVDPGPHVIAVEAPDHQPIEQETVAVADSAVAVILQPPPTPGRVTVKATTDARFFIDDAAVPPSPDPIDLLPGAHVLVARADGHRPERRPFDLGPGEEILLHVEFEPTTQRLAAWGAFGTSAALAAAGLTTGLLALDAESDAEALESRLGQGLTGADFDEHDRLRTRRDNLTSATVAIGVSAGVALTTGILMWVFDDAGQLPTDSRSSAL